MRFSEDTGRMLENSVAIELKRRGFALYYLKDRNGREVDFVLQKSDSVAGLVQACAHPDDPMVRQREEEPLDNALKHFKLKEGVIVTLDYAQTKTIDGKKISYVPAYKWFCGDPVRLSVLCKSLEPDPEQQAQKQDRPCCDDVARRILL
ncbi:MAG: DUF4143 domain-containing protein [Candidatus Micrarchaeota archaeon]